MYSIHSDLKHTPLEIIDVGGIGRACKEQWWNQSLVNVNDCVVRVGVFQGEFHWHKHDREDEVFFVLEGKLFVDVENKGTFELGPHQAVMVPRGIVHRTRAKERTVVLMIEASSVIPTGD